MSRDLIRNVEGNGEVKSHRPFVKCRAELSQIFAGAGTGRSVAWRRAFRINTSYGGDVEAQNLSPGSTATLAETLMNSRSKAILWAALPVLLLTPPLLWLGKGFENQLAKEQRTRTQHTLELHAAAMQRSLDRLEGKLDALEEFVARQTGKSEVVDLEQFNILGAGLHASGKWIRAFQIVSNGIITHTYPLQGNEAALGFNLLTATNPMVSNDFHRALKTGRMTITGPLPLVQGGLGIILRKPLARTNDAPARLVAVVFNIDSLLATSGISTKAIENVHLAIRRDTGEIFFGTPAVFADHPITHRLSLPDGYWEMGAKPLPGQVTGAHNPATLLYLAGAIIIFLICLLVGVLARRQADLTETVQERTRELQDELSARQQAETEQRRLKEQLETERTRLVEAQTVAKVGSWETDLATGAVIWSDETYRIFATDPTKFQPTHQGFLELVHPEDRRSVDQALLGSLDKRGPCAIEHRVLLPGSEIKFVEERWQTFHDSEGKPVRAIGTCQDITERKQTEKQLRALTARLESLREEERIRISREIHDELGQKLTGLKMDLHWMESRLEQIDDAKLRAVMEEKLIAASSTADDTMVTVQRIAAELRPAMLDNLGLISTLRYEAKQFEGRTGIPVILNLPVTPGNLDTKVTTSTYRIFQEVLTNVARHAQATKVEAALEITAEILRLRVEDNGIGVSPEDLLNTRSLGLLGMTERAAMLNGSVRVEGAPGQGTIVRLEIPIDNSATGDKQSVT